MSTRNEFVDINSKQSGYVALSVAGFIYMQRKQLQTDTNQSVT